MKYIIRTCILLVLPIWNLYSQRPVILTEDARTLGAGHIESGIGIEYYKKSQAPANDFPQSQIRLLVSSTHIGVAENVDLDLDWRGRLLARFEHGEEGSDWGDLMIASKINLITEREITPSIGIRSAVKLPNTSYLPYRLGSDQTDYYLHLLISKMIQNVNLSLNVGLGILGNPGAAGSQDDSYIYSAAATVPIGDRFQSFAEVFGFTGYFENDHKLIMRFGTSMELQGLQWNLYGSVRAVGDNRDFATAFESSENWSVALFIKKDFQI
ncbi:MAG: transporter [Ignavibacteriae bacterium]|nr:transporter [Ignavibacteriota bacterium]